jgi:hypothetical protein
LVLCGLAKARAASSNAKFVVDCFADQRLGKDGAMQMDDEIGALRHAFQEIVQGKRIATHVIERFGGTKLGRGSRSPERGTARARPSQQG